MNYDRLLIAGWLARLGLGLGVLTLPAAEVPVAAEATIQGGTSADTNVDESVGYIHVKFSTNLDLARKTYFQFDLAGQGADTNAPATFRIQFIASNKQRVQLWALDQGYPVFDAGITWNTAQANEPNSNSLLTNSMATATPIGPAELIPVSGTTPKEFILPRLGDWVFSNKVTLVLTGEADANNSSGGLRIQRTNAVLAFSQLPGDLPPRFSVISNQSIAVGASTGPLAFTLTDDVDDPMTLNPIATSSNPAVIPLANIGFGGAGSNRTVTVTAGSQAGVASLTLSAVDSQSYTGSVSFTVTVLSTNPPAANGTNYDVYLIGGQSNADGRGAISDLTNGLAAWQSPQPDIRIYYANPVNLDPLNPTYNTGWSILAPGFSVPPGFSGALPSAVFGPELSFVRAVADANTNRHIALIKVTQGGTSLTTDWNPTNGYLYATLTNMTRVALAALTNEGATYTLRGMMWHQGESNGSLSTSNYQARLTDFINAVRRDLAVTNLPFVVGELATNRSETVRQAQFNVAESMPYVGFASSSNLPTLAADDPHFTAASQLTMGQRMAAALEVPPLQFGEIAPAGNVVLLSASGLAGSRCHLLATTNLLPPFSQWSQVATGSFNASGFLTFTNPVTPANSARFFSLEGE